MIGHIKGTVEYREDPYIIVDVNGVGYKVLVPVTLLSSIKSLGEEIKLFTYTHVREDLLELYGFADPSDLKLFEYLISVNGVGCRMASGIFSVGSRSDIINAIVNNDVSFFISVPRMGRKNAQKIIIELKNKIGGGDDLDLSSDGAEGSEVIAALKSFGFNRSEAQDAIRSLNGKGDSVEEKIRLSLKYLGK